MMFRHFVFCVFAICLVFSGDHAFAGVRGRPGMVRDGHYVRPNYEVVNVEHYVEVHQREVPTGGTPWVTVGYGAGGAGKFYHFSGCGPGGCWSNTYNGYTVRNEFPATRTEFYEVPVTVETLSPVWPSVSSSQSRTVFYAPVQTTQPTYRRARSYGSVVVW